MLVPVATGAEEMYVAPIDTNRKRKATDDDDDDDDDGERDGKSNGVVVHSDQPALCCSCFCRTLET